MAGKGIKMDPKGMAQGLLSMKELFERSSSCLREEDSQFKPAEGMMTVAALVAHVAFTVDWFIEGMFRPEGFDLDFEKHAHQYTSVQSLTQARAEIVRAFTNAAEVIASKTEEELNQPLPAGPILPGMPRWAALEGIQDHSAHHRGALTVYSRLLGLTPPMPYA